MHALGVDRAVGWTILGRGWGAISGAVNVLFILRFLTATQQGFYYTFASILALQFVFDLGLSYVVLQFTSHERARLEWSDEGFLVGDSVAEARLASLARWAARWYAIVAAVMVCILVPLGLWFFTHQNSSGAHVIWRLPWVLVSLVTAGGFFLSPLLALVEGTGKVAEVAGIRLFQAMALSAGLWFGLAGGLGLYAAPLSAFSSLVVGASCLLVWYRGFLVYVFRRRRNEPRVDWRRELWPFQWRIGVSVFSGYLASYALTPILFAYQGAVQAGRLGMSMSVAGSIAAFAIAWMNTKSAPFGMLVANSDWGTLDKVWMRTAIQSTAVCAVLCVVAWSTVLLFAVIGLPVAHRFLALLPLAMLLLVAVTNNVWFCESLYLRAHKKEPFMLISVLNGAVIAGASLLLVQNWGVIGVVSAYAASSVTIGFCAGTLIFLRMRQAWHVLEYAE